MIGTLPSSRPTLHGNLSAAAACLLTLMTLTTSRPAGAATPIDIAIVFPGGPDAGGEGKKMIDELVAHLEGATGSAAGTFFGSYFNDNAAALAFLRTQKDAFVLGGVSFYLAHQKELGLVPLVAIKTGGETVERYYVVVQKGRYASVAALKGKKLSGSVLYEDARFLKALVFAGQPDPAAQFTLDPTPRPLSALRRLAKGELDAVLLSRQQYQGLPKLPIATSLDTIFTSEPVPSVGLMMRKSARTEAMRDKLVQAALALCGTAKGAPVCTTFGIDGFVAIDAPGVEAASKRFAEAR